MTTENKAPDAPLETPIKPPDIVREKTQAQYHFAPMEMADLGRKLAGCSSESDRLESELDSIKLDYKNKLAAVDLQKDALCQKLRDGYEMRETAAIVVFNRPSQGRKSYFREVDFDLRDGLHLGEFIREEAMSAADWQLPIFRTEDGKDATAPVAPTPAPEVATAPPAPTQPEKVPFYFDEANGDGTRADLERVADTGKAATPLRIALDSVAARTELPLLLIPDFETFAWTTASLLKAMRKAASKTWPEAHISTMRDIITATDGVEAAKDSLRPHVVPTVRPLKDILAAATADFPDETKLRAHYSKIVVHYPAQYPGGSSDAGFRSFREDIEDRVDVEMRQQATE